MARRTTGWRAEARALTEAVPYARSQRIRRRLRQRALEAPARQRWHWSPMFAFVAGAVLVLLIARPAFDTADMAEGTTRDDVAEASALTKGPSPEPAPTEPVAKARARDLALMVEGPAGETGSGDLLSDAGLRSSRPCVITGSGVVLRNDGREDLWIRGDAGEVELRRGRLEVEVDPNTERERPFAIVTPALRIEVTGTRFAVSHDEQTGGVLELWEGSVRVVERLGQTRSVSAGQRLQWQADGSALRLSAIGASSPEAPSPKTQRRRSEPRPPPAADQADRMVRTLERLREQGKLSEAVKLLEDGLPTLGRRDREVLSYELGQLLERTRGARAACTHWDGYLQAFPRSRYADLVEVERKQLECDG